MKIVMELEVGEGQIPNTDVEELNDKGMTKSSILWECWNKLCKDEVSFYRLCLILQSFCLIFPVSSRDSQPVQCSASSPATPQSMAKEQDNTSEASAQGQQNKNPAPETDTVYLIPSKLPCCDGPTESDAAKYKLTFFFKFQAFLPLEVYHRLLCLMLRDQKVNPRWTCTGTFTERYFQVKGVQNNNWMVQKVDNKLKIFVTQNDR